MTNDKVLIPTVYAGWHTYQQAMIQAIAPLDTAQLDLRAAPNLRSVGEMAAHVIGARARWFYRLMGEGGDEFGAFGRWDRRESKARSAAEIVGGLEATWIGMHAAMDGWSPKDWEQTWPGADDSEPEIITRPWVIWHLIEHDVHHGGEISITLGAHGVPGLGL